MLNEFEMSDPDPVYADRCYVASVGDIDPLADQVGAVFLGNGVVVVSDIGTDDAPATAADLAAELGTARSRRATLPAGHGVRRHGPRHFRD